MDDIEQLAAQGVAALDLRLRILSQIIDECKRDGDERYRNLLSQAEALNAARALALRRWREAQGIPEPPPVTILVRPGQCGVKGNR